MAAVSLAKLSRGDLDRILADFRDSTATIDASDIAEIDRALLGQPHGAARRAGLLAFTKSGQELLEISNRDRNGALAVAWSAVAARVAADGLRATADLLDAAATRAHLALCERVDMASVIAEAEATYSDGDVGHA